MAKRKSNGKGNGGRRRSKAENMTGAKANSAEVRELSLGEPVQIDSDTFKLHMRAIKSATEKKDTAVALVRTCMKNAKLVNTHLPDAIKQVIQLERADDPASLREKLEVLGIALRETGSPVQLSVHDILEGDPEKAAYERGKHDGLNGRTCQSPFPEGSALSENYLTGWRNGQGSNLGLTEEETQAAFAGSPPGESAPLPN